MGNRVAVLLAGGAAALLAIWWISSSAGGDQSPRVPALIEVAATELGGGNWARYSVIVKNAGDVPFSGTLVLLSGVPGGTTGGVSGIPRSLPNQVPSLPASAPDAGYEVHLGLGAHQQRALVLVAPDRYAMAAVAEDPGGRLVASAGVDRTPAAAIAVLSGSGTVVDQVGATRFDDTSIHVTQFADARVFPTSALGLAGFVAVVIDQFDGGALSAAQRQAISDFVAQGGSLVAVGGRDWRRTLGALPADLTGLRPSATGTASLRPVLASGGRPGQAVADIAVSDAPGARVTIASPDGVPLLTVAERGLGVVVGVAFDPAAMPVTEGAAATGWTVALAPAISHLGGVAASARTVAAVDPSTALAVPPPPGAALPSPWLVGPLILLYLLVVAPLNYMILRRRRRPDRLWMTAPLIAGLFAAGFYWIGAALGTDLGDSELQILKVAPGTVSAVEYHRVLFTHRGDHSIAWTLPALAAPLTDQLSVLGCGDRCGLDLAGLRSGEEHVVPAVRPGLTEKGVVYGGERVFGGAYTSHDRIGVETHLQLQGGRLVGDIRNAGGRALHDLAVVVTINGEVAQMPVPGILEPGRLIAVDGQPRAVANGEAGDAGGRAARLVALDAVRAWGGAWVVGGVDPLPSPVRVDGLPARARVTSVFEQQIPLASGGGSFAGLAPSRLVATAGERARGGFTDVYDLEVPIGSGGRLGVAYQAALYGTGVEVYDWKAGTWRKGGFDDDVAGTGLVQSLLSSAEVAPAGAGQRAAVRVRVTEPRIGWAAGISLFGA